MLQVDLPAAYTIGQLCAFLARKALQKEDNLFANRFLGPLNLYLSCGFAPGGLFLLIGWPAWECMYETPWFEQMFNKPVVTFAYVLFLIAMIILGNLGFILGHKWYRAGKNKLVTISMAIGLALTLLPFLLKWGVWMSIGTYAEVVEQNAGYSFWQPPFFHGWLFIMSYMTVATVIAGVWFKRQSKLSGT